jgi:hypothetical protein
VEIYNNMVVEVIVREEVVTYSNMVEVVIF